MCIKKHVDVNERRLVAYEMSDSVTVSLKNLKFFHVETYVRFTVVGIQRSSNLDIEDTCPKYII